MNNDKKEGKSVQKGREETRGTSEENKTIKYIHQIKSKMKNEIKGERGGRQRQRKKLERRNRCMKTKKNNQKQRKKKQKNTQTKQSTQLYHSKSPVRGRDIQRDS